ncbi:MAG TPA: hypothetical protein VGO47_14745 [Chlamydiales bacterium]|nr:hypothetical protein [Chlamydiales bacterium]
MLIIFAVFAAAMHKSYSDFCKRASHSNVLYLDMEADCPCHYHQAKRESAKESPASS